MWLSVLIAAADDSLVPAVGAGGAGLSAVLFYLLWESNKERRATQEKLDNFMMKSLPVLTSVSAMCERVLDVLANSSDRRSTDRDPEILRQAYEQLQRLLDENAPVPPPPPPRRRPRST